MSNGELDHMEIGKIRKVLDMGEKEAVSSMLDDVKARYGEIPYIIDFMKDMPELFISRMIYDSSVMQQMEHMDPKTVELISIAVASALRCEHCLKTHLRVAARLGVSKEEMFNAMLIAATISNAAVLADGTRSLDSVFSTRKEENYCTNEEDCAFCNVLTKPADEK